MLRCLGFPMTITLPGGRRYERYAYTFWRIRIPLWLVPAAAAWWALSWPGIAAGLAAGILAEAGLSYRKESGSVSASRASPPKGGSGGSGGPAGVREPRRPHPAGDAGGAQHATATEPE